MNVKELLDNKHITYRSSGKDYLVKCLNPEHDDNNPSMRIDKVTGLFNCFSCGYGGDLYKLFGVNKDKFIDLKVEALKEKIMDILMDKSMTLPLDASKFDRDYRDISADTYKHFEAFTTESLEDMKGRVVFPLKDINGDIYALIGRYLWSDLDPRYKINPSNAKLSLYPPVVEPINNSIILVEGIFDFLNLWDKGLHNVVCTFGTSFGNVKKFKKQNENIDKLLQYKYQGVDTIYIMYDGDKPGRDAAKNLKNYISKTFITETIDLEDDLDPGKLDVHDVQSLKEVLYGESSDS